MQHEPRLSNRVIEPVVSFEDYFAVDGKIDSEKVKNFFQKLAFKYGESGPIIDSVIRQEQERRITEDLKLGASVAVRGVWRMGKTSMLLSIRTHEFHGQGLYIDVGVVGSADELSLAFSYAVAEFIIRKEHAGIELANEFIMEKKIQDEIESSGQSPIAFLERYLAAQNSVAYLSLDEVRALADVPGCMELISSIAQYPHIKLAIVLHAVASKESAFEKHFGKFKTHFVEPLTEQDATLLIRRHIIGTPVQVTDAAIATIIEYTGGRPMDINRVCVCLFSRDAVADPRDMQLIFDVADVHSALADQKNLYDFLKVTRDNYKHVFEHALDDEHRMLLVELSDRGVIPYNEVDFSTVNFLIKTTFVRADDARGGYVINGTLFEKYLREQIIPYRRSL